MDMPAVIPPARSVVNTRPAGGKEAIPFGLGVAYDNDGCVVVMGTAGAKNSFVGVAVREVKSAWDYRNQNEGSYLPATQSLC